MPAELTFDATSLKRPRSAKPLLTRLNGTHNQSAALAYDDATEEFGDGHFNVPGNIDAAGTVTFRAVVSAVTGAASKNVKLRMSHHASGDGDAFDAAKTNEDSADTAIDASAANQTIVSWTETVANLGWAAHNAVRFTVSRVGASADDLGGDMYLHQFKISIPVS